MASIVIVGGGVAGLTCAWLLRRAGHVVEVLDRAVEPGGRLRPTPPIGSRPLCAVPRFYGPDVCTRQLTAKLGLTAVDDAPATVMWNGRALLPVDLARPLRGAPHLSSRQLGSVARELWRARRAEPSDLADTAPVPPQPDPAVDAWLGLLLDESGGATGAEAGEATRLALLQRAQAGLSGWRPYEGPEQLVRALAASVPVRRGCEVLAVETETGGARVRYRVGPRVRSVVADAAVVAVPLERVDALCPKLTPDERGFFEGRASVASLVLQARLEHAPSVRFERLRVPPQASVDVRELAFQIGSSGAPLLRVELRGRSVARFWAAAPSDVDLWLREHLAPLPFTLPRLAGAVLQRFVAGHTRALPGAAEALRRFRHRIDRSPRLFFAGEGLCGPGVEGAVMSAREATDEAARLL